MVNFFFYKNSNGKELFFDADSLTHITQQNKYPSGGDCCKIGMMNPHPYMNDCYIKPINLNLDIDSDNLDSDNNKNNNSETASYKLFSGPPVSFMEIPSNSVKSMLANNDKKNHIKVPPVAPIVCYNVHLKGVAEFGPSPPITISDSVREELVYFMKHGKYMPVQPNKQNNNTAPTQTTKSNIHTKKQEDVYEDIDPYELTIDI